MGVKGFGSVGARVAYFSCATFTVKDGEVAAMIHAVFGGLFHATAGICRARLRRGWERS